jgi:Flp pilus assembly protein TadG
MHHAASHDCRRKGAVILLTTALLGAILPIVGLAIDSSLLFAIKARLSAASDAAALAGARALQRGMTLELQIGAATATAQAFFNANFPEGYLMTRNRVLNVTVSESDYKTRSVRIAASVDAPTFFMRVLGLNLTTVSAVGVASRRDVNLVLVLDRSYSMSGAMTAMKAAVRAFVEKFSEGRDNLGLIVFGGSSLIAFPNPSPTGPQSNFKTASPNVDTLISQTVSGSNTGSAQALWLAYQELVKKNEPGALNVIVFFTDGLPNGLVADFNDPNPALNLLKASSTCTYKLQPGRPMLGFISQWGGFAPTGTTVGVKKLNASTVSSIDEGPIQTNSTGCYYRTDQTRMRQDVVRMPNPDYYGNTTSPGIRTVDLNRVDSPQQIGYASLNAADSAVQRIRQDANLSVVIDTIGYFGGTEQPDEAWLKRIANDPSSPDYDPAKPRGVFVMAPTTAQLNDAFMKVASEILRLAM